MLPLKNVYFVMIFCINRHEMINAVCFLLFNYALISTVNTSLYFEIPVIQM